MTVRNLDALFEPRAVALVGASSRPGTVAAALTRNLLASQPKVPIHLVNPGHSEIFGRTSVRRVRDLPRPVDLAAVAVPQRARRAVLRELAEHGVRACLLVDRDPTMTARARAPEPDEHLLGRARRHCMRVVGPGAIGLMLPAAGINLSVYPALPERGRTALVTTTWSVAAGALAWAARRGIGFSCAMALGDGMDVDEGDLLDRLGADPATDAIVLQIDHVRDTRKFMSAARAAARTKPVITLRAGRTLDEDGLTDAVYAAAIRRAGMLRVAGLDALYLALESLRRPLEGRRLRLFPVCNSPQVAALLLDGIRFEGEPLGQLGRECLARLQRTEGVGVLGEGNALVCSSGNGSGDFAACLPPLLAEPDLAVLLVHVPDHHGSGADSARAVAALLRGDTQARRRVTACWLDPDETVGSILSTAGVVHVDMPGSAITAHRLREEYQRNQISLMETPPARRASSAIDYGRIRTRLAGFGGSQKEPLEGEQAQSLLADAGLPAAPPERVLEMPGLQVGVEDRRDFGPVIRVRLEGFRMVDHAVGLLPLNVKLAGELVDLACSGDAPPGWREAASEVLVLIAELIIAVPAVAHLEARFAPVPGGGLGTTGARMTIDRRTTARARFLAIRPYPAELVETFESPGGQRFLIRPIRPEDEPGLRQAFEQLSDEEVRMRFMYRLKSLTHSHAARLTQIDYDREMALILIDPDSDTPDRPLGVVRMVIDPGQEDAEFAIIVAGRITRRGMGRALLERLIAYARGRGIRHLYGDVLPENKAMLALARRLGFRRTAHPEERGLLRLNLELR